MLAAVASVCCWLLCASWLSSCDILKRRPALPCPCPTSANAFGCLQSELWTLIAACGTCLRLHPGPSGPPYSTGLTDWGAVPLLSVPRVLLWAFPPQPPSHPPVLGGSFPATSSAGDPGRMAGVPNSTLKARSTAFKLQVSTHSSSMKLIQWFPTRDFYNGAESKVVLESQIGAKNKEGWRAPGMAEELEESLEGPQQVSRMNS